MKMQYVPIWNILRMMVRYIKQNFITAKDIDFDEFGQVTKERIRIYEKSY